MPRFAAMLDASALRAVETRAIAALGGDDAALMRRAGAAAWRCLLDRWPGAARIRIACGPGNNGGDGYALALQALQAGRDVRVVRLAEHAPRTPAARTACADFEAAGGRIASFDGAWPEGDLAVDAVFGIGLSRAPDGSARALLAAIGTAGVPVFALDVPSGVDADRGTVHPGALRADCTLQFIGAHPGLATGAALDFAGDAAVDALGIDGAWLEAAPVAAERMAPAALQDWLPQRARNSHKGDNGHVLCIGGDIGSGGAVLLCAQAALRTGAGLATVATREAHVAALLARQPEAMARAVDAAQALPPLLAKASVVAVGPGLGQGEWGRALFASALDAGKPLVIDADALNLLAASPRRVPADAILTPHPGEAARLLDADAATVQSDRFGAARSLADRHGAVVVLKGAGTIVAAPGSVPRVVAAGNPGMASGGMGDLLTGVIAALRAQGMEPFDAASCGALLHAHAGDLAARDGMRGLLAGDLLPYLRRCANPAAWRA